MLVSSTKNLWAEYDSNVLCDKLSNIKSNIVMNASCSGEKVERKSLFLKGSPVIALCNVISNFTGHDDSTHTHS